MRPIVALAIATLCACRPPGSAGAPDDGVEERALELAAAIGAEGFTIDLARVRVEPLGGEAWVERVGADVDRAHGPAYWEAMAALRAALAIAPAHPAATVRDEVARARAAERRAVYDATASTIFVALDAAGDPLLDRDLVRALAGAYQHRHLREGEEDSTDASVARGCLRDGHADVLAFAVLVGRPLSSVDDAWFGPIGTPVAGEVEVTCAAGGRTLAAIARDGGWPAALRAVETPPRSTEQLLHPDKRGSDEPARVDLPELEPGDAELVFDDTLGELAIARLLRERGLRSGSAWRSAIGWDGDRLRVYRRADGSRAIAWRSVWDREKDARQFARAIEGASVVVVREGRVVDAVAGDRGGALARTLAGTRAQPREDPRDVRTTIAAERAGSIVD
jgi:hypothetical protein